MDKLEASVAALEEHLAKAKVAAGRIHGALEAGRECDPADIEAVSSFGEALRVAGEEAAGSDGEEPSRSLSDLRDDLRKAQEHQRTSREKLNDALRRLAEAPAEDAGPDLLEPCRRRAAALLEQRDLEDAGDLKVAEGLALLLRLNEAPAEEKGALTEAAQNLLPADCMVALGVAAVGKLRTGKDDVGPTAAAGPPAAAGPEPAGTADGASPAEEPIEAAEDPEAEKASADDEAAAEGLARENESPVDASASRRVAPMPPEPEVTPEEEREPTDEEVVAALRTLLEERRLGLAHWIVRAWSEGDAGLGTALEALAYAWAMRSSVGESATRFRELAEEFPFDKLRGNRAANLIALAASLRAALVAPYSGAGDLLGAVGPSFAEPAGLSQLITEIETVARRGLSAAHMGDQVQTLAMAEDNLAAVQARAEEMRRFNKIKFQRASNVWRKWIEPDGLLGSLLVSVIENQVDRLEEIEQEVFELRIPKNLARHLEETDRLLRSANRQRPIIADARHKLVERAEESLAIVADWVELSKELEHRRQREANAKWQQGLLYDLRAVARSVREEVLEAVEEWSTDKTLEAAAAAAAGQVIEEVFGIVLDGESPAGAEDPAEEILGLDLLRVRGLGLSPRLDPLDDLRLPALIAAVSAGNWEEAFHARLEETNFSVAARIIEVLREEDPEAAERLEKERRARYEDERGHLQQKLDFAARRLGAARREGRISDSEGLSLNNRLSGLALAEEEQDFRGRETAIDQFLAELEKMEAAGEEAAHEKYQPLLAESEVLKPHRERLERLLKRGEISTLEEFVLAIERGERPPEEEDLLFNQLTGFFPEVVEDAEVAKATAREEALLEAVASRGCFGKLDFQGLKDEEIEPVQGAIAAWQRIECRDFKNIEDDLVQVLDLIGLTVEQSVDPKLWEKRRNERRKVVELAAQPLGKALVPAFGSGTPDGKYRVRMLWERMSDEAIASTIRQEPGDHPIVLLCFGGPLSSTVRRGVADQLRHQRNRRAVAPIDGPSFLYLASRGGRNLATTMRITLPFSAVNPYTPFVAGSVPLEMFYGRNRELDEIIDRSGTSFIYGGRRLGKSALLRAAERKFNADGPTQLAVYVDLKSKGIGEWKAEGEIVTEISKALNDANVMTTTAAKDPSFEELRNQVRSWLDVEGTRRILLLLDESDSFLDADAKASFRNVNQLKSLMEETERRFKPVFAGLHQVRRFQRIPNQPLAQLGFPTPIGPLKPQPAYDLITKPLETLGFKFENPDLPSRILTATNYLPSLIQLFCSELVDHMLGKSCGPNSPPYLVTSADVEAVYQTPRVVEEMRTRFHLTANLDPRYRVIANAVAFEALEQGLSVGLGANEIRAICEEYWAAGFAETGTDEFGALLEEMDSLGILFKEDGKFLMRSPNVLRMLGTAEQIEEQLKASSELSLAQGFEATSFRDALGGDQYRRRPLTHQQVASLRVEEDHESLVRVVVGSAATGIGDAMACLRELSRSEFGECNFYDASQEKRLLSRFNKPAKKKRRVVGYRFGETSVKEARSLIGRVAQKVSTPESRSTVVFVVGADALPIWRALIAPVGDSDDAVESFDVIELKRWSKAGLRAWVQAQEVDLFFNEDESLAELMRVTGGWPMLVDKVVSAYTAKRDWRQTLGDLEQWMDSPAGAAEICEAIGLGGDEDLIAAWNVLLAYDEPIARESFQELADGEVVDPARASEMLRSMQVLELDGDGRYVAEPTAARAWKRVGSSISDAVA